MRPSISQKPDESCGVVEVRTAILLHQSNYQTPSEGPTTPDSNRENGELSHDLSSPLTCVSSPHNVICFNSNLSKSPTSPNGDNAHTPKESVFDPFAPGPGKFMLAPHPRKYMEGLGTNVAQKLNFMCAKSLIGDINCETSRETTSEEDNLFESVYNAILDAIVSEQTKELVTNAKTQVSDSDGFRTPNFARRLSGIAETCPGAPVKSTSKCRNIGKELCRKLEF
ncbi:hypothetical protein CDL12_30259 [Handroanthus impetiginosus]|uniref:Uncharacterized protein n=1 Tax=Handroanthus impetiginosus TaxID=429701 RepID=A0A2G9FW37_9LAMI|nr:hypothetical protein CDL12_30259 [Handroanthus impetiginosus]